MKLVFFSNSLNHHQVNVADEFYKILGQEYAFVTTIDTRKVELKGGVDYSSRPYCIKAGNEEEAHRKAMQLARTAKVCVFGAESLAYAIERAKTPNCGLSFELSERWLKRGLINILSPRLLRSMWHYHTLFRKKPFYKLCSSAFAASDQHKLFSYPNRCFKWGYFTKTAAGHTPHRNTIRSCGARDSFSLNIRNYPYKWQQDSKRKAISLYSICMEMAWNSKKPKPSQELSK